MDRTERAVAVANIAAVGVRRVRSGGRLRGDRRCGPSAAGPPVPLPADPAPLRRPRRSHGARARCDPRGLPGLGCWRRTGRSLPRARSVRPRLGPRSKPPCWARTRFPSAPGAGPGVVPNLNVFNNAYGPQQCLVPSAPGKCEQFDVAPGDENADVSRREWLGRYIDMYRAGMLKGGLLGQMPQEQLGEPLPGTAPPPGTNVPPGLVQFLPDPAAPPDGARSAASRCAAASATSACGLTGATGHRAGTRGV